jgi:SAM-dependent methyltransferase
MVKIGSPEQFAKVRELLDSKDYSETALCRRLGIESLLKFEVAADTIKAEGWDTDAQGLLVRLFVENRYVPVALAVEFFGEDAVQTLADLGLIERNPANEDEICATVSLYSTAGVYVISDRWNHPDRTPFKPPEDVVYPAIVSNAQYFLRFLPRTPCRNLLDIGTGSGVAALTGAKHFAERATGIDIAQRSCLFAEFNRQLNGLDNVTIAHGDLYEPVAGQQFDRIVAHPPYVPVFRHRYIYRDGGPDGEQIVRRVVEGLPAHLAPGGMFYLMALVSDREQELFEQRVRRWLGDAHSDFDVANFPLNSVEPDEYAARAAVHTEKPSEDLKSFQKLFRELKVTSMIYVVLLVQRKAEPRDAFTVRRQGQTNTPISSLLWLLDFETSVRQSGGIERLLDKRVAANPEVSFRVTHKLAGEGWAVDNYVLQTGQPFSMEARTDPWAAHLLATAGTGTHTLREVVDFLKQQEVLPAQLAPEEFAQAVAVLISGGFLRVEQ